VYEWLLYVHGGAVAPLYCFASDKGVPGQEWKRAAAEMFSFVDFNHDGVVTRLEILEAPILDKSPSRTQPNPVPNELFHSLSVLQIFALFKIPINVKQDLDRVMGGSRPEMSQAEFFELMCRDEVLPLRRLVMRMRIYFDLFQLFDRDQSGKISHFEIGRTITDLFGWRPTKYECEKIIAIGEGYLDRCWGCGHFTLN